MNIYHLVLQGKNNIHYRTLNDFLEKKLDLSIKTIEFETILTHLFHENSFILIDVSNLKDEDVASWQDALFGFSSSVSTILLNTDETYHKQKILKWPNCCGVFDIDSPLEEFVLGMQKIINGEYWLPRAMMTELLKHYRVDLKSPSNTKHINISAREREVLALLPKCKSNIDIADTLFISEHTVKSHLYKVFKKINVKNRLQAEIWVKENL